MAFNGDGTLEGAACWRADGTPIGVSGGLARPGIRFQPAREPPRDVVRLPTRSAGQRRVDSPCAGQNQDVLIWFGSKVLATRPE